MKRLFHISETDRLADKSIEVEPTLHVQIDKHRESRDGRQSPYQHRLQ